MKTKIIETTGFFLLILLITILSVAMSRCIDNNKEKEQETTKQDTLYFDDETAYIDEWELLKLAIIEVESTNNDLAHNKDGDCLGCMQITPIYVAECNRIAGYEKYTLEDRKSRNKSLEMFETMNSHHNPTKNIHRAIEIHNKGSVYKAKILNKMEEMRDCF